MRLPVYLDNNATTSLDPRVLEAMLPVFSEHFGNPSSTTHSYGWYAEELVQIAREKIAASINAAPTEIIFTSGATESNNLALQIRPNPAEACFVALAIEHRSVLDPLLKLQSRGAGLTLLPVDESGILSVDSLTSHLRPEDNFLSIMLANNEIGVIQDIKALARAARNINPKILFQCDASQAFGKIPIDVKDLDVDLLSLSAHKIYGPKGAGVLYRRSGLKLNPLLFGGGHEAGLRAGTLNVPAIVGFGAAAELVVRELDQNSERMTRLGSQLLSGLQKAFDGISLNGSAKSRIPGNLNLAIEGVDNATLLGEIQADLAFSVSSACTSASSEPSYVLKALGLNRKAQTSSIRLGIGRFNTDEEIEFALAKLLTAIKKLR